MVPFECLLTCFPFFFSFSNNYNRFPTPSTMTSEKPPPTNP